MKKILFGLVGLFIASQLLVSCGSENAMLSQFSKRKYLKKFKDKNVKYEDKVGELETEIVYETKQEEMIVASTEKQILPVQIQDEKTVEVPALTVEQEEQIAKVKTLVNDYSAWNKYNRTIDFSNKEFKTSHTTHNKSKSSSEANAIVLIILCILVITAPLAVYLFEGSITNNFWLDLILLLTLIGAAIYGLLVCFAGVSI